MKIKSLTTLLFLCIAAQVFSQEEDRWFYSSYYLTEGNTYYIYSDVANIRSGAGKDFEKTDQLLCGEEITVLETIQDAEETINGLRARWAKVSYQKNNELKEGYVWGINLSPTQLRRGDIKFVFGLDALKDKGDGDYKYMAQVKVVQAGKGIISRKEFETQTVPLINGGIIDNTGLIDVEKVIKILFSGEACGEPSIDYFFAWNGKEIKYMTNIYSMGDADMYGHSESLIFPMAFDCGYCNTVIKFVSEYEKTEKEDGTLSEEELRRYKSEVYVWDGNKLILQDQNWGEK